VTVWQRRAWASSSCISCVISVAGAPSLRAFSKLARRCSLEAHCRSSVAASQAWLASLPASTRSTCGP
jgi:hypothetical protein